MFRYCLSKSQLCVIKYQSSKLEIENCPQTGRSRKITELIVSSNRNLWQNKQKKKKKTIRLQFVKEHVYWTIQDWKKVAFSDKSNFFWQWWKMIYLSSNWNKKWCAVSKSNREAQRREHSSWECFFCWMCWITCANYKHYWSMLRIKRYSKSSFNVLC